MPLVCAVGVHDMCTARRPRVWKYLCIRVCVYVIMYALVQHSAGET
jgi:hypothetical protein